MLLSIPEHYCHIGLFGGSFDPPHWGHIRTAARACDELKLELLAFLPAVHPPHKRDQTLTPFSLRRQMLELCLSLDARFRLCLVEAEFDLGGTTLATVAKLRELGYTEERCHLIWLIGSDSLLELDSWRQPDELLDSIAVAVLPRTGYSAQEARQKYLKKVQLLNTPLIDLAAHDIRSKRRTLEESVPAPVAEFIRQEELYGYHKDSK